MSTLASQFRPKLRRRRGQKVVRVGVKTPHGTRWVSTGQTTYERARQVCTEAMVAELQMAECAKALTPEVICRLTMGRRITCLDVLATWKEEAAMKIAPDTLANYEATLRQWMAALGCEQCVLARVRRADVYAFINADGISAGTRRQRRSALVAFYTFAHDHGFVVGNIAHSIEVNKRDLHFELLEPRETVPITAEEYALLMASPKLTGFWRWATAFGWCLGYRLRDVACLEWANIQAERIVIYPRKKRRGGGAPQRLELSLDDPLLNPDQLRQILLEMLDQPKLDPRYCFPAKREIAMDVNRRAGLSVDYQRVLTRHGITGKRFHGLRHAFAMRLKTAGRSDIDVGQVLGHASVSATQIYTRHTV